MDTIVVMAVFGWRCFLDVAVTYACGMPTFAPGTEAAVRQRNENDATAKPGMFETWAL